MAIQNGTNLTHRGLYTRSHRDTSFSAIAEGALMRSPVVVLLASVLLVWYPASSQNRDTLEAAFQNALRRAADSLLAEQKAYVGTLFSSGDSYFLGAAWALRSRLDSTLAANRDSLDVTRANNIRLLNREQERTMSVLGQPERARIRVLFAAFESNLRSLLAASDHCPTCKDAEDFGDAESAFRESADSISGIFGDSMATIVDSWETVIDDTSSAFSGNLDDTLQTLKEDYADYVKNHATRLEFDAGYESQATYRGRDNGVSEASFGPTVTYHHKSGLFLAGSLGWVSQSTSAPDVSGLTAGYEFTASTLWEGSVSYTRYWYSASSPLPQAVTDQEVSGTLGMTLDPLGIEGTLLDDFTAGGGSEITIGLEVSTDFVLSEHAFGGVLTLDPAATATWGQQSERLLQKRIARAKKREIVRVSGTPYDVFGIMAYGLSLPIDLEIGDLAIVPVLEWTLPVDVLNQKTVLVKDPSSSSSYFSGGLSLSMTLY